MAATWLEEGKALWSAGTHRQKRSRVERFLIPALGALPVTKIGATELRPVLDACRGAGAWAGVHAKVDLGGIFDFAVRKDLVTAVQSPDSGRW